MKSLLVMLLMVFSYTNTVAQVEWNLSGTTSAVNNIVDGIHRKGNVGIGVSTPLSKLSINGQGDKRFGAYITAANQGNGSTGLFAEMPTIVGGSDRVRAVFGGIPSGIGYSIGVQGYSYNPIPSNQGRAYGIFAQAGNANINYGVYSSLLGSNRGAAIFGNAKVADTDRSILFDGKWAAYLLGDTHISDRLAIGTTNMPTFLGNFNLSDYSLYVCGGVLADEFLIPNVAWCDYVFEDDYELISLEEVSTHIEENGYLHNTPSAKMVETEGLKIAAMTINQQEKIEEIFLHLIEMNEELKQLKTENAALKAAIQKSK